MADANQPSTKPGIFGAYENAGRTRQANLNEALGDKLNPRRLGKKKPRPANQGSQGNQSNSGNQ